MPSWWGLGCIGLVVAIAAAAPLFRGLKRVFGRGVQSHSTVHATQDELEGKQSE